MKYRINFAVITPILLTLSNPAAAQSPKDMSGDTTAARITMRAVFGQLSGFIADAAVQKNDLPWSISFPAASGVPWASYADHVVRIVKGRAELPSDSMIVTLDIRSMQMRGDTLVSEFSIGARSKCRGEWKGNTTYYEVRAVWEGTSWTYPSKTKWIGEGISIACQR